MSWTDIKKDFKRNKTIYLMIFPVLLFFIIFKYVPMGGIIMAFQRFSPKLGIYGSKMGGVCSILKIFSEAIIFSDC